MAEPGTTRDPRDKKSTAASTALTLGVPGTLLIWIFPEMEPEMVLGISGAVTVLSGYVGAALRDSQFIDPDKYDPGSWKDLLMTFLSKVLV